MPSSLRWLPRLGVGLDHRPPWTVTGLQLLHDDDRERPPPKAAALDRQWKELYAEVITTGLCTGCAGCVVACPHDVIGYEHERASTSRSTWRRSSASTTASTARRAARRAPAPARASGPGSRPPTAPVRPRARTGRDVRASGGSCCLTPGQRRHGPQDGPGRRVRVGDAHLADGERLHRRALTSFSEGRRRRRVEGQAGGRGPNKEEILASAGSRYTYSRQHAGASSRPRRRALARLALVGMGCQTSVAADHVGPQGGQGRQGRSCSTSACSARRRSTTRSSPSCSRPSTA